MLSMKQLFVPAIPRRNLETPQEHSSSIENNKIFTGNGPGKTQKKQRRNHISKEKKLESEFTPERWAHLMQFFAATARFNEKGLINDATRNPKQEFRNVTKEYTPTRNPRQDFWNVARDTAARKPKQEFRNVVTVVPEIEYAGKYIDKGNETLRTKEESERMPVAMFHGVDIKIEARDNKRLTSKENKGKETLNSKNGWESSEELMLSQ